MIEILWTVLGFSVLSNHKCLSKRPIDCILWGVYGFAVLSLRICSDESADLQSLVYGFAVVVLGGFKCLRFSSAQSTLFNCLQLSTFPGKVRKLLNFENWHSG